MITVREEEPQDIEAIRHVNKAAFRQSREADIVDRLRHSEADVLSLVAMVRARIVAHIVFSTLTIEGQNRSWHGMALGPMAVLPAYQRQGIGSKLVRAGIDRLKEPGCPFVIVLGHPAYYPRFGFEPASRYGIQSPWKVPEDAFMILLLDKSKLHGICGVARYLPEFEQEV